MRKLELNQMGNLQGGSTKSQWGCGVVVLAVDLSIPCPWSPFV